MNRVFVNLLLGVLALAALSGNLEARRGRGGATASSGTGPTAPAQLQLINQGGAGNGPASSSYTFNGNTFPYSGTALSNYEGVTWTPGTAGSYSISKYNIYRNGSLYDNVSTPITISGCISNGSGSAGTTFVVTAVSGGASANSISDGKILAGTMLNSAAGGFIAGTQVYAYTTATTGGGGTGTYSVNQSQLVGTSTGASCTTPATFTAFEFNDTAATNANNPSFIGAGTIYNYTVTAVDTASNESAQTPQITCVFCGSAIATQGGNFNYGGTGNVPSVASTPTDTAGSPVNGPYDWAVTWYGYGGFLPVFGTSGMGLSPTQRFELGAYKYLQFDMKIPDNAGTINQLQFIPVLRSYGTLTGSGDTYHIAQVNVQSYGTPTAGAWVHYKIPFSDVSYGTANITASFVGTAQYTGTLTITAINSKTFAVVDGSDYVTGAGIPANSYLTAEGTGTGGTGTYTVTSPNIVGTENVSSETMTLQGTGAYKFGFQWSANTPMSGCSITGTAGQFSCTAPSQTLLVGTPVLITGTPTGTGSITGYATPNAYVISATNGSTTFTIQSTSNSAITTTTGTTTGLTFALGQRAYFNNIEYTTN